MTTGTGKVLHEGRRVFAEGKGPWRTIAELYGYFAVAGVVAGVLEGESLGVVIVISMGLATALALLILLKSRGGVQITASEVRVSSWRGTTVISRAQIAEVVHIKDLQVMGTVKGYLGLLDDRGAPLWRTATNAWTKETAKALSRVGRSRSVVPTMRSQDAAQQWPGMLPWSLANPNKAFWAAVAGSLVFFALLGVFFWWLFTGPLA